MATQLPDRIKRLEELAHDLWWSWNTDARRIFRSLDYPLWRQTAHNPVRMLQLILPEQLTSAMADPEWLANYDRTIERLDSARSAKKTWVETEYPELGKRSIAYFSAEFALHQSLPIYAGGLGALAGDHCKEASDLGVPLVGIGFMYPQGYFHQGLSPDGWQQEIYERLNWKEAAIEPATTPDGKPAITAVPLGNRTVLVAVWRVRVGRVTLYLLDTDLEENAPWDRELSARLYGGDRETRVQQEIILGIGGVRVLKAIGHQPTGLPSERRTRRVRRAPADSRSVRERLELRQRACGSPPDHGVHDAHAGGSGSRRLSVSPGGVASGRRLG
jgi:starch phosphorylase